MNNLQTIQLENSNESRHLEFTFQTNAYILLIKKLKNNINLKLRNILELKSWETLIDYCDFQRQYPFIFFDIDTFIDFICSNIKDNNFKLLFVNLELTFEFDIQFGSGKFSQIKPFTLSLNYIDFQPEKSTDFSCITSNLKNLKLEFENYKFTNEKNILELKKDKNSLESKIYDLTQELKLIKNKLEICINSLTSENVSKPEVIEEIVEPHYQFITNNQNLQQLVVTNEGRTVSKLGERRVGVRCHEIPSALGEYTYRIRIDKTTTANIIIGFCLKSHNGRNGYFDSHCLVGLLLKNGYVYCSTTGNVDANYEKGKSGMIITVKLNTFNCTVDYIGKPFTISKKFNLNADEKKNICFCVSLSDELDTVTILN